MNVLGLVVLSHPGECVVWLALAGLGLVGLWLWFGREPADAPPGKLGLPWLGETVEFLGNPFDFFSSRMSKYGSVFKTRLLGDTVVCLCGPEAITFFYDDRYFTRENASPHSFQEFFHPDAIPFLAGPAQERRRELLLAAFKDKAIAGYEPMLKEVIDHHFRRWEALGDFRATDETGRLCFAIANCLFAGAEPTAEDRSVASDFQIVLEGLFAPPIPLPFTAYGKAMKARDRLRAHFRRCVDEVETETDHVLNRLRTARTKKGEALSQEELAIEIFHFFLASYAALQSALVGLTRVLAENSNVATKLREELDLGSTEYARRVTLEVRRTARIAPGTFFARVLEDCEFAGYRLRKGWKALAPLHCSMQDPDVFRNPDQFDPERFSEDQCAARPDNSYVPHGGGPWSGHRCVGEALADLVLERYCHKAAAEFDWEMPSQNLRYEMAGLSPLPVDGLRVRMTPRRD